MTTMTASTLLTRRRGMTTPKYKYIIPIAYFGFFALFTLLFLLLLSLTFSDAPDQSSLNFYDVKNIARPFEATKEPIKIAYAISLIKCGDFQSSAEGMSDAAIVLRHSIHLNSIRNPNSGSKYDYQMYAIVHEKATACAKQLEQAGFSIIVVPPPLQPTDVASPILRKNMHKEWCCGHDEFIKLHAYRMTEHPVVVHLDVDFIFHQHMDDLFDVLIYNDEAAKARVEREFPQDPWPERVEAFLTRDWPQVMPGRIPMFQAGFLVLKPNNSVYEDIIRTIKTSNYTEGFNRDNGWGGKGYGGAVGAMAVQGILAYYYDWIRPTAVELNQCRHNHMGMDVLYRNQPSFRRNHPRKGKCRNYRDYCEDCMVTNLDQIHSIHYTQCRKPWNCVGEGIDTAEGINAFAEPTVYKDHCLELVSVWHNVRYDLETKLLGMTGDATIKDGQEGSYKAEVFRGHCKGNGAAHYLALSGKQTTLQRIPELYNISALI